MAGQVATFIDSLHMSKSEVMRTEYVLLTIMVADKMRIEHEPEVEVKKVSGREMLERKKQQQKK